jgi:Arc/MetJ family transcription regulator
MLHSGVLGGVMRTTVTIDAEKLGELVKVSHSKTKSQAVCLAVEEYLRRQRIEELLALRGRLRFDRAILRLRHRER